MEEHRWALSFYEDHQDRGPKHRHAQHGVPMLLLRLGWPDEYERHYKKDVRDEKTEPYKDKNIASNLDLSPLAPLKGRIAPIVPSDNSSNQEKQSKERRAKTE